MAYSIQELTLLHESSNSHIYYKAGSAHDEPVIKALVQIKLDDKLTLVKDNVVGIVPSIPLLSGCGEPRGSAGWIGTIHIIQGGMPWNASCDLDLLFCLS